MALVEILISTYLGSKFVAEQLDSLLGQSYENICITIRDDGSNDSTLAIVESYSRKYPGKFNVLADKENLGSRKSFMRLLENSSADYVMFCDQDDVWYPNKVFDTFTEMLSLEEIYGKTYPLLVFTDLTTTDSRLNIVSSSLWQSQRLDPNITGNWKKLMAQNVVSGCTIMVNRNVKAFLQPFTGLNIFHDHLISVLVSKFGHIGWIDKPTIFYRQHDENVAGALKVDLLYAIKKLRELRGLFIFFMDASHCFKGEVNVIELIYYKFITNIRRIIW